MRTVSVVTPLYNSVSFIEGTLNSLLAQTYTDWESLLIDDGSTDNTAEVVEPYLEDKRFKYIRQENQGIAGARNTAIRAATGDWICLLDHDDRWLPTKLEKQMRFALMYGCQIVGTDAFIVEPAGRWIHSSIFPEVAAKARLSATDPSIDVLELYLQINFTCACSMMLKKSLFDERGLLDPEAAPADDYEMWLRCMPEAKFGYISEPLVEYIIHGENFSLNEVRMLGKIIYALKKHRCRYAGDARRLKQFDAALAFNYDLLFRRLLDGERVGGMLRNIRELLVDGTLGFQMLRHVAGTMFLTRLKNSVRYRLGLVQAHTDL